MTARSLFSEVIFGVNAMDKFTGAAAPLPAFISFAVARLAEISAIVQVITLLFGCAISGVMLVSWYYKARRERAADKLAELKLNEAVNKQKQ
jgi:hypothetical protein